MSIGTYADAAGLPASALRYYDEIGLLVPEQVDATTGYRWYTPATVDRARRIRDLRAIGLSVETMRAILDGPRTAAATTLTTMAELREREGAEIVAVLRALAAEYRNDPVPGAADAGVGAEVDGPRLGEALRAAAALCGDRAPVDRVLLEPSAGHLDVLATDRFRLFADRLPVTGAVPSRATIPAGEIDALAAWAEQQTSVTVTPGAPSRLSALGNEAPVQPRPADDFPDLTSLRDAWGTAARLVLDRAALLAALAATNTLCTVAVDEHGQVHLDTTRLGWVPGGVAAVPMVSFTSTLLSGAVALLSGPTVSLGMTQPERPCVLWGTAQPVRQVMIMPARRDHAVRG